MNFTYSRLPLAVLALGLGGLTASNDALSEERRAMLEEIVVTARKVEESAQDVPVAITAITEELNQSSVRNLVDLNGYDTHCYTILT